MKRYVCLVTLLLTFFCFIPIDKTYAVEVSNTEFSVRYPGRVLDFIRFQISELKGIEDRESIKEESNFSYDLYMDDDDMRNLLMHVGDEFGILFPSDIMKSPTSFFETVGRLCDYVEARI